MNITFIKSLKYCIKKLNENKVIAYPTESVFGLGCNPDSKNAVKKLLSLKNRNINKGFILISSNYNQLVPYISEKKILNKKKILLENKFFLTYLVPAVQGIPVWLTGDSKFIAVRITKNKFIKNLCFIYGKPIISTSANISGYKPCLNNYEIENIFGKNFPILKGFLGDGKRPSKIVNLITGEIVRD
ncbi:MAG: L-threonylcarbamoyladenylate synthase type 1 TsaC [Buchnera aphidicola (Periphyllus aceris)]|nr:L-threonylcarbamoyladenylate synthase type 1 TsaC [Buchnera aphidicola (Periphyllus aceris)]